MEDNISTEELAKASKAINDDMERWKGEATFERKLLAIRDHIAREREYHQIGEGSIEIIITATGRTEGDFAIEYAVGMRYGSNSTSNDLDAAVSEHIRRDVWEKGNQPKLLAGHGRG